PALLEMALSLPASQADYRSLRAVLLSGDWVALDLPGPDRVKTQQTMTINFRGFSQRLGGRRRPNQAQSIIL
ncbi:hypothetical protein, partial [Pseudomonas aeruginosa]